MRWNWKLYLCDNEFVGKRRWKDANVDRKHAIHFVHWKKLKTSNGGILRSKYFDEMYRYTIDITILTIIT